MSNQPNTAGTLVAQAWQRSGLSLREIARRAGTSHATLNAYIKGTKSPTTVTLERIIDACDMALNVSLSPRIRRANALPRGEELAQVLRLAEAFPSSPPRHPRYPKFPQAKQN